MDTLQTRTMRSEPPVARSFAADADRGGRRGRTVVHLDHDPPGAEVDEPHDRRRLSASPGEPHGGELARSPRSRRRATRVDARDQAHRASGDEPEATVLPRQQHVAGRGDRCVASPAARRHRHPGALSGHDDPAVVDGDRRPCPRRRPPTAAALPPGRRREGATPSAPAGGRPRRSASATATAESRASRSPSSGSVGSNDTAAASSSRACASRASARALPRWTRAKTATRP